MKWISVAFSGTCNRLLPFPLNSDFINNYRRLYGPVQLTSNDRENNLVKISNQSPSETTKHFKGKQTLALKAKTIIEKTDFDVISSWNERVLFSMSRLQHICVLKLELNF